MVGKTPTNPWVFLLKMISTWGVKWGENPPFKETPPKKSNLHNLHGVLEVQRLPLRFSDMASGQPAAGTVVGKLTSN